MLQVIEKDGICFSFASDKLKNDKEFIIQAIKKDYRSYLFACDELFSDKEIMLKLKQAIIEKNK